MSRRSMRLASTSTDFPGNDGDDDEWIAKKDQPAIQERRRSIRKITENKLHKEYVVDNYSRKRNVTNVVVTESEPESELSDNNDEYEQHEKPATLFQENQDVAGADLFTFHTPKKRNGMARLAANTPKTPKLSAAVEAMSLNTPKSRGRPSRAETTKTPHQERLKIHKRIREEVEEDELSGEDFFTDEDSDYRGSDQSASSSEDDSSAKSSSDSDETNMPAKRNNRGNVRAVKEVEQSTAPASIARSTRLQQRLQRTQDCLPQSDNYFSSQSSKKNKTSNRTLGHLKNSRLQCDDLFALLKSIKLSEEHATKIQELNKDHKSMFAKWMIVLSKGFNVILYGLGSKQRLIHQFCQSELAHRPLMIVNGFFPTLTVKDILHTITTEILNVKMSCRNNHESVGAIAAAFKSSPQTHFFLIINNIDGPMLRKTKDQHILSRLAKIPNIHLICSIDHINAPMMWDQTCMNNFSFLWYDCTSMLPYINETAFETSAYMRNSGELGLAAMSNVFRSLTSNAKNIYMLLARNQLKNSKDSNYQGMSFADLYRGCREGFFVTSDNLLRTQLTEFFDHNMCKNKRSVDGTEYLIIPIEQNILEQFVEQQGG